MGKNIVCFSDGTGNSAASVFKTNVFRAFEALERNNGKQVAIYDDGVGTSSFRPLAILGGVFGFGLGRNIRSLYQTICEHYEPGDKIFLFGFSRGAFTMRVLAAMIGHQGLVKSREQIGTGASLPISQRTLQKRVGWAYRNYRRRYKFGKKETERALIIESLRSFRDAVLRLIQRVPAEYSTKLKSNNLASYTSDADDGVKVNFLGLWDTVDAFGGPFEELTAGWSKYVWPLLPPDQKPWKGIERICHALAIDDERDAFHPRLIDQAEDAGDKGSPDRNQTSRWSLNDERISQVWFAGMHADVGGGYAKDSLSYVPLVWMLKEAEICGLNFNKELLKVYRSRADSRGHLNDSRAGFGAYYRYQPRDISKIVAKQNVSIGEVKIHHSVFERILARPAEYAPIGLPNSFRIVDSKRDVVTPAEFGLTLLPKGLAQQQHLSGKVWDHVWKRRVLYFLTILLTVLLAMFPLLAGNMPDSFGQLKVVQGSKCTVSSLCFVSDLITAAGQFLPGFISPWMKTFAANPALFALVLAAIALTMSFGARESQNVTAAMMKVWHGDGKGLVANARGEIGKSTIERLRTHPVYIAFFEGMKLKVLPFALGLPLSLLIYLGLPYGLIQWGSFRFLDSTAALCIPHKRPASVSRLDVPVQPTNSRRFDGSDPCWGTGLELVAGNTYEIRMKMEGEWWDSDSLSAKHQAKDEIPRLGHLARTWLCLKGELDEEPPLRAGQISPIGTNSESRYRADFTGLKQQLSPLKRALAFALKRKPMENYFVPIARIVSRKNYENCVVGQDEYVLNSTAQSPEGPSILISRFTPVTSGELFLYLNDAQMLFPDTYANNNAVASLTVTKVLPYPCSDIVCAQR